MNVKNITVRGCRGFLLILFISLGFYSTAQAAIKSVTGQLKLSATVDSRPAFSPVIWKISASRVHGRAQRFVKTIRKHAATIDLQPGTYDVVFSTKQQAQTHKITIVESELYSLTINLD